MADCHDYEPLIAGMLDGELTVDETLTIKEHLIRCAACRADYEQLRRSQNRLEAISFLEVTDEAVQGLWRLPYSRAARTAALALVVGGYAALLVFAVLAFLADGAHGLATKVAAGAVAIGFLVLLGMLVLERVLTYKVDPYKEIER